MAFTVKMFSAEGVFIRQFGGRGREAGRTQRPTGVAVVPSNDNILIADYDCKWISVFDRTGRYIRRFGQGKLLGPKGVAVDAYGRIVVVDNKQSAIFVYSSDYKLIRRFGTRGTRPHQLAGPHYVAFGLEGELFVTDFHHHCVKVYDISGEYLFSFGENGDGDGQFNAPTGIAVDSDGTVLVADWGNNRIQVSRVEYICVLTIDPICRHLTAKARIVRWSPARPTTFTDPKESSSSNRAS